MKNFKFVLGMMVLILCTSFAYNIFQEKSKEKSNIPLEQRANKITLTENEKINNKALSEQSAPAETKIEQTKEVLNLGITIDEFKSEFNRIAVERNVPQLTLNDIQFFDNGGKFVQQYPAGLYLFGIVDKKTSLLKEVTIGREFILNENKRQSEVEVAGVTFLVAVAALNPELSPNERAEILNRLSEKPKNSSFVVGNAEYSSLLFDKGKSLSLSIKAKDSKD